MKILILLFNIAFTALIISGCGQPNQNTSIDFSYTGYHTLAVTRQGNLEEVVITRILLDSLKERYGLNTEDVKSTFAWNERSAEWTDKVPVSFGEMTYQYVIVAGKDSISFTTDTHHFPENLRPEISITGKPGWEKIYQKSWDLTWQRVVTSDTLPTKFAYNDYPDNNFTYVWDAAFCNLFQRYAEAQGGHPGILTYDGFYEASKQYENGYIPRRINITNLTPPEKEVAPSQRGTNPPLFGWAEWNHYLITNDASRFAKVLPLLIANFDFIEEDMQKAPGKYIWGGDGSGWDNIDWGEEGSQLKYWVELPALQAFSAEYIIKIATLLKEDAIVDEFTARKQEKKRQMEQYWNEEKGWYCGLTETGGFTRKTLQGIWPVMAGLVDPKRVERIADNLRDSSVFNTHPIPLPTLAKDEIGYNPKGEYWLGSVWINMSLVTIQALREHGHSELARDLAIRTLDGIYGVYQDWEEAPQTLWECYAPEFVAPASHKTKFPDQLGTVRTEFGGWTGCLINLMIEEVFGIHVDAPNNQINWNIGFKEDFSLKNLQFGKITTEISSSHKDDKLSISIQTNHQYVLNIEQNGEIKSFTVMPERDNEIEL